MGECSSKQDNEVLPHHNSQNIVLNIQNFKISNNNIHQKNSIRSDINHNKIKISSLNLNNLSSVGLGIDLTLKIYNLCEKSTLNMNYFNSSFIPYFEDNLYTNEKFIKKFQDLNAILLDGVSNILHDQLFRILDESIFGFHGKFNTSDSDEELNFELVNLISTKSPNLKLKINKQPSLNKQKTPAEKQLKLELFDNFNISESSFEKDFDSEKREKSSRMNKNKTKSPYSTYLFKDSMNNSNYFNKLKKESMKKIQSIPQNIVQRNNNATIKTNSNSKKIYTRHIKINLKDLEFEDSTQKEDFSDSANKNIGKKENQNSSIFCKLQQKTSYIKNKDKPLNEININSTRVNTEDFKIEIPFEQAIKLAKIKNKFLFKKSSFSELNINQKLNDFKTLDELFEKFEID